MLQSLGMVKSFYCQHKRNINTYMYRDTNRDPDAASHWHSILLIHLCLKPAGFAWLVVIDSNGSVVCKRSAVKSLRIRKIWLLCLEGFWITFSYRFVSYKCDFNWGERTRISQTAWFPLLSVISSLAHQPLKSGEDLHSAEEVLDHFMSVLQFGLYWAMDRVKYWTWVKFSLASVVFLSQTQRKPGDVVM